MDLFKDLKSFLKKAKKPLIVILGPTASGKTALSLEVARQLNGEIVSTDSRQIYKGMEIGTDMILPDKQNGIPHHLLGITTPNKTITLAEYKEMVLETIKTIYKRKKLPILVGGTGLYISAVTENYVVPQVKPNEKLRQKLQQEAKDKGVEFVYEKLMKLDPIAAKKIHPNNLRYVIRAIEINMSGQKKVDKKAKPLFDVFMVGISWPREKLYERINQRVKAQFDNGLVEEVKALLKQGHGENLPSMTSLGVKEVIPFIKKKISLEECMETLRKNIRHYAKRQMTWFKKYKDIKWLTPKELMEIAKIEKFKAPEAEAKKELKAVVKEVKKVEKKVVKAVKKLAKPKAKKPVKKIIKKTAKKLPNKVTKKPIKKVVAKKAVKKIVKKIIKKPIKKLIKKAPKKKRK